MNQRFAPARRLVLSLAASICLLLVQGCGPASGIVEALRAQLAGDTAPSALYTCGMHPEVVQEGPGSCPICGMDLTPMSAQTGGDGVVAVDPAATQSVGVRTALVERQTLFRHLRTVGEIEVGEDRVSTVNLRFSGWIERLRVARTGDPVRAGQALFDVYSPELVAAQEELLRGLAAGGAEAPLARSARRRLVLWGIAESDVDAVIAAGEPQRALPVRAKTSGYVLHLNAVEGARVEAGRDLYRIADLGSVWVTAEIYAFDAPWVEEGQPAQIELPFLKGEVLEGEVAWIDPTLSSETRTLTARLEFENPGLRLKPGMFATVYVQYRRLEDALAVPTEAVIHSGRREIVFVALGGGRFEPREIVTGLRADHHLIEVVEGLAPGEEIVVSGQFLLDSESQLQAALERLRVGAEAERDRQRDAALWSCPMHPEVISLDPEGRCPDCGMFLEERTGTSEELQSLHGASPAAQPGQYTCPMHPEVISDGPGRCPDCNMFLELVE